MYGLSPALARPTCVLGVGKSCEVLEGCAGVAARIEHEACGENLTKPISFGIIAKSATASAQI